MLKNFKRTYLRLVRRAYRYLRSKKLREIDWLQALIKPVFDRELWHPCRSTIARGLSIGLFCAMLPIPFQMILAAIGSIRTKANIPIAIGSCWVSNPFTMIPIFIAQGKIGTALSPIFLFPIEPLIEESKTHFPFLERSINFGVGFLASAIILALLAYPFVWALSFLLPRLIPKNRYIIRRRKKSSSDLSITK